MKPSRVLGRWNILFLALAFWAICVEPAWACPNCKNSLQASGWERAYAASIVFMLAVPALLVFSWVIAIYRLRRLVNLGA